MRDTEFLWRKVLTYATCMAYTLPPFSIILVYIALSDCLVRAVMSVVDLDKPSKLNLRVPLILYPSINMFPQVNT